MNITHYLRKFSRIIFAIGLILIIYFLKQGNWMKSLNRLVISIGNSEYHNRTIPRTAIKNFVNYNSLLRDFGNYNTWSLSNFLGTNEYGNNHGETSKKKRICILSIDTRPLERFTAVKDIDKMNFYSIAAYNALFYGKKFIDILHHLV